MNTAKTPMTVEQCMYDLQWQPMMLGITKQERYARARRARKERQQQREERVLFLQSMLFTALCFVIGVGLVIVGGCL